MTQRLKCAKEAVLASCQRRRRGNPARFPGWPGRGLRFSPAFAGHVRSQRPSLPRPLSPAVSAACFCLLRPSPEPPREAQSWVPGEALLLRVLGYEASGADLPSRKETAAETAEPKANRRGANHADGRRKDKASTGTGRRGPFSPVWTPSWLERRAEVEITLEPRALTQRSRQRLCSARSSIRNRSDYLLSRLNRTWTQQSIRGPLMKPGCWPPSNGCRGKRPGGRPLRTAHSSRTRPAQAVLHRRGRGLTQHASGGVLSWRPDPNSTALAAAWGPGTEVTASRDEGLSHEAMWELCVRRRGGHCCWKPRSRTVSSS
ncbi:uncharacterized protein LOC144369002 isoform X2 [Ictidomys tridecemlineatus]